MSSYKVIDGKKYDAGMLAAVENVEGKLGMSDAKKLLQQTLDGGKYTDIEKATMAHIRSKFTFTEKADKFVRKEVASFAAKKAIKDAAKDAAKKDDDTKKEGAKKDDEKAPMDTSDDGEKKKGYYRQIDGVRYDRGLLEAAEKGVAGPHDGRISIEDAKLLFEEAVDGDKYTICEKRTMSYIRDHFKFTDAADKYLRHEIASWAAKKAAASKKAGDAKKSPAKADAKKSPKKRAAPEAAAEEPAAKKAKVAKVATGEYKTIAGIKYDRGMLSYAESAKNGRIGLGNAKHLLEEALDGDKYTEVERRTMRYIRVNFEFTEKADAFIRHEIQSWAAKKAAAKKAAAAAKGTPSKKAATPAKDAKKDAKKDEPKKASTSYYRQIDGVRYDRSMLEKADESVAGVGDGRISEKDAKAIWEDAADGGHYTETERRTLAFIKKTYKCTEKAVAMFDALEKEWAASH